MDDTISRRDAIKTSLEFFVEFLGGAFHENEQKELMTRFQRLPSADLWIPVSEYLPEKDDLVLVTVWNDVTIAWRNRYGGWESAEYDYKKGNVLAWMPRPEPYRKGNK